MDGRTDVTHAHTWSTVFQLGDVLVVSRRGHTNGPPVGSGYLDPREVTSAGESQGRIAGTVLSESTNKLKTELLRCTLSRVDDQPSKATEGK
jgi:hypothetical protein